MEDKIIRPLVLRLHGLLDARQEQPAPTGGTAPARRIFDSCETYIQRRSTTK